MLSIGASRFVLLCVPEGNQTLGISAYGSLMRWLESAMMNPSCQKIIDLVLSKDGSPWIPQLHPSRAEESTSLCSISSTPKVSLSHQVHNREAT
jgi:hypothetical protein